jgi:hypothetical protein
MKGFRKMNPWQRVKNREQSDKPKPDPKPNRYQRFFHQCEKLGIPLPQDEIQFKNYRKWSFDFAWPEHLLALEVEGGGWSKGRHTRGTGFRNDLKKYMAATLAGWTLIRVDPGMIQSGYAARMIAKWFEKFVFSQNPGVGDDP